VKISEEDTRLTIDGKMETVSSTIKGLGDIDVTAFPYQHQVIVTSAGGVDRVYTLQIERIKSSNAKLKDIILSDGSLSPSFDEDTLSYEVSVDDEVSSIDINAILNKGQTVAGDGTHTLNYGDNTINITVKLPVCMNGNTHPRDTVVITVDGKQYTSKRVILDGSSVDIAVPSESGKEIKINVSLSAIGASQDFVINVNQNKNKTVDFSSYSDSNEE